MRLWEIKMEVFPDPDDYEPYRLSIIVVAGPDSDEAIGFAKSELSRRGFTHEGEIIDVQPQFRVNVTKAIRGEEIHIITKRAAECCGPESTLSVLSYDADNSY